MMTWINGQPASQLSSSDRGLAYGDGLFETIKVIAGQPLLLAAHLQRLADGLRRLKFPEDTLSLLQSDLNQLSLEGDLVMKITLTRGEGGRGYRFPEPCQVSRIIAVTPMPEFPGDPAGQGVTVRFCQTQLGINPLLAGMKHLNRLEQVLARNEWTESHIAEGVVCDLEGYLVEGTMSNLFWLKGDQLFTPDLSRAGVNGIIRQLIISKAQTIGLTVNVGRYRPQEMLDADEMFVSNSLIDIWPVIALGGWRSGVGSWTCQLQRLIQQEYSSS